MLVIDPKDLPQDIDRLQEIVVELCGRLKHETSEKDTPIPPGRSFPR